MKALVTGGAGFIGSHIVDRLLHDGHDVIVIDDLSTGHRSNLPDHDALTFIEGDFSNSDTVNECMVGIDWVFHKAAVASVPRTVNDPVGSSAVNYQGTLHLLEAARNNDVKRFVFASSAALYGDEPTLPKVESMCPVTLSPYAVDKLASEFACGMYTKLYGVETVCLRYFNVYGPRQDPLGEAGVVGIFINLMLDNKQPVIFGDGKQTRDYVYVKDVVNANIHAIENGDNEAFNIGTGKETDVNELFAELKDLTNYKGKAKYAPARPGELLRNCLDISKAKKLLNWSPKYSLKQGLKETMDWISSQNK
jgi:UDP-glucose 4-epimerase